MNRLKFLRIEKGETLEKLADFLNVTIQTISNYENEKRDMTPDTIVKLADYFNVSTDFLLGKSDIRNPDEAEIIENFNDNNWITMNNYDAAICQIEVDNNGNVSLINTDLK